MWQQSVSFVVVGVIFSVTCVAASSPIACRPGEQLGSCGRICELKCNTMRSPPCGSIPCDMVACQCKPGLYRNNENDKCVPLSECPKPKCRQHEILGPCGDICEATCEQPFIPQKCKTMKCARQGCQCDLSRGYVRDHETGNCTRNQDDKKCAAKITCLKNSTPRLCGGSCEPNCEHPQERHCRLDPSRCVIGCHCVKDYVRNPMTGRCMERSQCPRHSD